MVLGMVALLAMVCGCEGAGQTDPFSLDGAQYRASLPLGGYQEAVAKALLPGADPKAPIDCNGDTVLHWAALCGDLASIEVLIGRGAGVESRNGHGRTPLHMAALGRSIKAVDGLVKRGAAVLSRDSFQMSAADIAAAKGDTEILARLAEAGGDLRARNMVGYTPLSYAVWYDEGEACGFLLSHGASLDASSSAGLGDLENLKKHLGDDGSEVGSVDGWGRNRLHWAALSDSTETAALLVERGVNGSVRDRFGFSAVDYALMRGHFAVARLLIGKGFKARKLKTSGGYALAGAARGGTRDEMEMLLRMGVDVNGAPDAMTGLTALHFAASVGETVRIRMLLELGADVNGMGVRPSPLELAVAKAHCETVRLLIEGGVDVNVSGVCGETPLHRAVRAGNMKLVRLLVDAEASLAARSHGETPLDAAVLSGCGEIAAYLAEADVARHRRERKK